MHQQGWRHQTALHHPKVKCSVQLSPAASVHQSPFCITRAAATWASDQSSTAVLSLGKSIKKVLERLEQAIELGDSWVNLARLCCMATIQGRHAADGGQVESLVAPKHRHVRQLAAADGFTGFTAGGHSPASSAPATTGLHLVHPCCPFSIHSQCPLVTLMFYVNHTHVLD